MTIEEKHIDILLKTLSLIERSVLESKTRLSTVTDLCLRGYIDCEAAEKAEIPYRAELKERKHDEALINKALAAVRPRICDFFPRQESDQMTADEIGDLEYLVNSYVSDGKIIIDEDLANRYRWNDYKDGSANG